MQFLISRHINPAVLDALTGEAKAAIGDGRGKFIEARYAGTASSKGVRTPYRWLASA